MVSCVNATSRGSVRRDGRRLNSCPVSSDRAVDHPLDRRFVYMPRTHLNSLIASPPPTLDAVWADSRAAGDVRGACSLQFVSAPGRASDLEARIIFFASEDPQSRVGVAIPVHVLAAAVRSREISAEGRLLRSGRRDAVATLRLAVNASGALDIDIHPAADQPHGCLQVADPSLQRAVDDVVAWNIDDAHRTASAA